MSKSGEAPKSKMVKKAEDNKKKANRIIRYRTLMASGIGFIPFPILDAAGILSIQLWMISDLAKIYKVPFQKNIARSIIGSLLSNVGVVSVVKLIPGANLLGTGAVVASAGTATFALGKVFLQHFAQGGTLLSFDPVKSQAHFDKAYEESKVTVEELQQQEGSFKEADMQAISSVATLKKANSELMETIGNLEKQLKNSKRERAVAVAAAKAQSSVKKVVPARKAKKTKKKLGLMGWIWRILIFILLIGLLWFALYQFGYLGWGEDDPSMLNEEPPTNIPVDGGASTTNYDDDANAAYTDTASYNNTDTSGFQSAVDSMYNSEINNSTNAGDSSSTDGSTGSLTPTTPNEPASAGDTTNSSTLAN